MPGQASRELFPLPSKLLSFCLINDPRFVVLMRVLVASWSFVGVERRLSCCCWLVFCLSWTELLAAEVVVPPVTLPHHHWDKIRRPLILSGCLILLVLLKAHISDLMLSRNLGETTEQDTFVQFKLVIIFPLDLPEVWPQLWFGVFQSARYPDA